MLTQQKRLYVFAHEPLQEFGKMPIESMKKVTERCHGRQIHKFSCIALLCVWITRTIVCVCCVGTLPL